MSFLAKLKQAQSTSDIAKILGCSPAALTYTLYKNRTKYTEFKIKKKNGGERIISVPEKKLKELQRRLSKGLQECINEINAKRKFETSSHGFVKGKSIFTNAYKHKNKNLVLNIDLANFFDSINFGRVRGYFIHNREFALSDKVSSILAQIVCYDNKLPQGSPCSPVISNLIAQILDVKLSALAKKYNCYYTRYVDDITFSTNQNIFPASMISLQEREVVVSGQLKKEIERAGFKINSGKTRLQFKNSRQDVTGLVVNKKVNVKHELKHIARAMTNSFFKLNSAYISIDNRMEEVSLDRLNGILSFIYHIRSKMNDNSDTKNKGMLDSFDKMYSKFLFYKIFAANKSTVVICEGETDNIYLQYAFQNLVGSYPELQLIKKGVKKKINIFLYKQTKTLSHLLNVTDGTGNNIKLIKTYKQNMSGFVCPPQNYPVILLMDNDSGSNGIDGLINRDFSDTREIHDGYTYVCENLYVVKTPLIDEKKETKIEDFFDCKTLSKKLGDKTFSASNNFDKSLYFGKRKFAELIVKQNHKEIDFSNFKMIIDLFYLVICDYQKRLI